MDARRPDGSRQSYADVNSNLERGFVFLFFRMKFFFVLVNKFFLVCCGQKGGSVKVLLVNLQCFGEFVL